MAVALRLQRCGAPSKPTFRLVVVDRRKKRDGAVLEILGHLNFRRMRSPKGALETQEGKINFDAVKRWLNLGAIPSSTVKSLLKRSR